uniref:Uncharacterized protein n=1 Tax=Leersia perrieri TaxID=77586 RepID=A0A0D9XLT6_9ORYZ
MKWIACMNSTSRLQIGVENICSYQPLNVVIVPGQEREASASQAQSGAARDGRRRRRRSTHVRSD